MGIWCRSVTIIFFIRSRIYVSYCRPSNLSDCKRTTTNDMVNTPPNPMLNLPVSVPLYPAYKQCVPQYPSPAYIPFWPPGPWGAGGQSFTLARNMSHCMCSRHVTHSKQQQAVGGFVKNGSRWHVGSHWSSIDGTIRQESSTMHNNILRSTVSALMGCLFCV